MTIDYKYYRGKIQYRRSKTIYLKTLSKTRIRYPFIYVQYIDWRVRAIA